jgi:hypothetical protein
MPEVRYICLSDLHLGADNSLLSHLGSHPGEVDAAQPSEVLLELANCLRELVRHNYSQVRPTLILNGDALELALTQDNVALMVFERFMELMFPADSEPLIAPVILLNPGNHDHHLWEIARETQYIELLQGKRSKLQDGPLPAPWHTTSIFNQRPVDSVLLNAVISRHPHMASQGVSVATVYPNFCLKNENSKWVIFSHGHYIESVYSLMSLLSNFVFPRRQHPTRIGEIETENFAWIDFFWSAMGRSGAAGKGIEQIYDMLLVRHARRKLIRRLARAAGHHWIPWAPWLGEWLSLLAVPFILKLLDRTAVLEKTRTGTSLSPQARQGLKAYIEGPLAAQIWGEDKHPSPAHTAFVFGHTHKPFAEAMDFRHFPPGVAVYNTGGWVVDTEQTEPTHGGAILLLDEQFNLASLRMYNEARNPHDYRVRVEAVDSSRNPLYSHLGRLVNSDQDPWRSFSQAVAANIERYHRNFRRRLSMARVV